MKFSKRYLWLICSAFFCSASFAHSISNSLGESASATDIIAISCDDNSTGMYVELLATLAKPTTNDVLVSALLLGSEKAMTITDPSSKDNVGNIVEFSSKSGLLLLVSKNNIGEVDYSLEAHCQPESSHPSTDALEPSALQNQ